LRTRVWRLLAVEAGSGAGQLTAAHVESLDALLTSWHGQGPLNLPGHVRASRSGDLVTVAAVSPVG
jgi:tRNA(Ile)-lysidine synthase